MLQDLFKNRRVQILLASVIILCTIAILMLKNVVDEETERRIAAATQQAVQTVVPTAIPVTPVIISTPNEQVDDNLPEDWRTQGTDTCSFPISAYMEAVGIEFHIGSGVWNSDSPCMSWTDTGHYYLPDPTVKEKYATPYPQADGTTRYEYDIPKSEYSYDPGHIVIAAVIDHEWVVTHVANDDRLSKYDDTVLHLEQWIDDDQAVWVIYDMRTSEKVVLTLTADGQFQEQKVLTDLADIVADLEPDNACNWPHTLTFVSELLEEKPDSEIIFASNNWFELSGCDVGYTYVENRSEELLVVIKGDQIRTTLLTGLEYSYVEASDRSGNLFFSSSAEFLTISDDNTVSLQKGNLNLLWELSRITIGSIDSNLDTYALYQQSLDTPLATGMQFTPRNYQRPLNEAGEETANIYPFTFKSDGKWYTGVVVYDFETSQYYGPFVIDNIREITRWHSSPGELIGYYNDGTSVTLTLSTAQSITTK